MHCSGRSACAGGRSPGAIKSRYAFQQSRATPTASLHCHRLEHRNLARSCAHRRIGQQAVVSRAASSSQASVTLRAPTGAQQQTLQQEDATVPRSLLIAIDHTSDAEQALQWALDFIVKPGDQVTLVHVISNPRASSADLGAAAGGYHRGPDFGDVQERRKFMKRLEQSELEKVNQRFQPMLQAAAVSYEVKLPLQQGQKSAQGIGQALCQTAQDLSATVMIIASHGTGVLADYGSVAGYCSQNSTAPVLMIPPNVSSLQTKQPGNLMVVALANIEGLKRVASFTLANLYRPDDTIHTTYVEDTAGTEVMPSQHSVSDQMEEAVKGWFSVSPHDNVKYEVNLMTAQGPLESSDMDLGEEICAKADQLEARAVVLLHHGKGMMKEMVYGSITSYATRNCKRPLLVYYQ